LEQEYFFPISGIYLELKGQILTEESGVDLGSDLCWGKLKVPCLQPVTDVFQLKVSRAAMQSHFVCIGKYSYFLQRSMWSEPWINLN